MDVRYINAFVTAVRKTFETMVGTQVKVERPRLEQHGQSIGDVSGIIGLSGDASGRVVLSFPGAVAARVASAFAGADLDEKHPDFSDAIGELANMVAGSAKAEMHGLRISISLPSVVMGKEHAVTSVRDCPRIVLPCQTDHGVVFVDVSMKTEKAAEAPAPAAAGIAR